jgi:hypothetical protein
MRNTTEIRVWMLRNGHSVDSLRRELGHANHTPVSLTIGGKNHLRPVLRLLLEKGCPYEYLDLPKDMREAASYKSC